MIKEVRGTVFNQGAEAVVNTINTVGFMGTGLALEFALRYPMLEEDYKNKCKNHEISVGKMYYFITDDVKIVNFPTKIDFKFPSQRKWIEDGLKDFVATYRQLNVRSVAFPRLGTSHGGLDWESVVRPLMIKYLGDLDIEIIICGDDTCAEGLELQMINRFNESDFINIQEIKLNQKQRNILESAKPIKRFYQILKLESIGINTYRNLFNYFRSNNSGVKQFSIFE